MARNVFGVRNSIAFHFFHVFYSSVLLLNESVEVTSTFQFGFDESSDPIEIVSPQGKTVTVSPGVDLNLTCHSAFPVNWELDTGNLDNDYFIMKSIQYRKIRIYESLSNDPKRPYITNLALRNINYKYAGSFYCIFKEVMYTIPSADWLSEKYKERMEDALMTGDAKKVHLFVNDPSNPTPQSGSDHKFEKVAIVTFVVIFVFLVMIAILWIRFQEEQDMVKKLNEAGLWYFEKGNIKSINPILRLNEQADLLPYNRKYEFPKDKINWDKILGQGEFGVVTKAYARGILPGTDEETPVAIKTVKEKRNLGAMRALVSELKILVHLGQHLNIVNLLGAVTENIAQLELFVIVEYCPRGNLLSVLQKRENFINQIDYDCDKIDSSIITKRKPAMSGYSSATTASDAEQENESDELFTTTDLLSWSFQVARGMHYLSSRNVVHSDLAARNVLLTKDNVVKICDFGLSRTMYRDVYLKKGTDPLPFRWMAIESIQSDVFSTLSDVWSFGVFMWELFSLGDVPYADTPYNDELLSKLKDGHRLKKPMFATERIYDIMKTCWSEQSDRPLFNRLEKVIATMVPSDEVTRFIKLNEPFMLMNARNGIGGSDDLLAKMSSTIGSTKMYENDTMNSDGLEDFEMHRTTHQYLPMQSIPPKVSTAPT